MLDDKKFETALKRFNKDLWLRKNNGLTGIQQLMFKEDKVGGVPLGFYPLYDVYSGISLAWRGMINVAALVYKLGSFSKFERLLQDLNITGKDKALLLARLTRQPTLFGITRDEYYLNIRLESVHINGQDRLKVLRHMKVKNLGYDIGDKELMDLVIELFPNRY